MIKLKALLLLCVFVLSASAMRITEISANTCKVSPSSSALYIGQKLFLIEDGELEGTLEVKTLFHSYFTAALKTGRMKTGGELRTSLKGTYREFVSDADVKLLVSWYKDLVLNSKSRRFLEWSDAFALKYQLAPNIDFSDEAGWRFALNKTWQKISADSASDSSAYKDFYRIALGSFVEKKSQMDKLDIFLRRHPHSALSADALYLKAKSFADMGRLDESLLELDVFMRRYASSENAASAVLLAAKVRGRKGHTEKSLAYAKVLIDSSNNGRLRDEALFTAWQAEMERGSNQAAASYLEEMRLNPSSMQALEEALFLEYQMQKFLLTNHEKASLLAAELSNTAPQSAWLAEIQRLEILYSTNSRDAATTAGELLKIVRAWPDKPAGIEAYRSAVGIYASLGRIREVNELMENCRAFYPAVDREFSAAPSAVTNTFAALKKLAALGEADAMRYSNASKYDRLLPYIAGRFITDGAAISNKIFLSNLDKAMEYKIGWLRISNKLEVPNQMLAAVFTWSEPALREAAVYDTDVLDVILENLFETVVEFSPRPRGKIDAWTKELSQSLSAVRMQAWNYKRFEYLKILEPEKAEKIAYDLLSVKCRERFSRPVFLYFTQQIAKKEELSWKYAIYERVRGAWQKDDEQTDALKILIEGEKQVFERKARLGSGAAPSFPSHARVFGKENDFELFDLRKDFNIRGYRSDWQQLEVSGIEPRIESRLLHLEAWRSRTLILDMHTPPGVFSNAVVEWIGENDLDWSAERSLSFTLTDFGDLDQVIALSHPLWKGNIRRLRVRFMDLPKPAENSPQVLLLRRIAIY